MRPRASRASLLCGAICVLAVAALVGGTEQLDRSGSEPRAHANLAPAARTTAVPLRLTSIPRRPWVAPDGTVREDLAPRPPGPDPWLSSDGTVDCAALPTTIGVATVDGKLLLDRAGREVRMPSALYMERCGEPITPELLAAVTAEVDALAAESARLRGRQPLPPPVVYD